MLKKLISVAVASLLLVAFSSSAAPIVNGRFETGTFSGWGAGGSYVAVVDSRAGGPMIQGQHSALLVARDDHPHFPQDCDADPWARTCEIPIPFPSTPTTSRLSLANSFPNQEQFDEEVILPLQGTASIGTRFEAHAGDHLTLDWRWLSNDIPAPFFNFSDNAIFGIESGETLVQKSGYALGICGPAPPITGFRYHFTGCPLDLIVPFDGNWLLSIEVGHGLEDFMWSSGVLIDNVRLRNVPEPGGLLLLLIGATGAAWARRRKE